jgi:hypothetical protein
MRWAQLGGLVGALALVAACSGSSKPNAAATTSATTTAATTATTAASAVDYGNQYLALVGPGNAAKATFDAAIKALEAAHGNNLTGADLTPLAAALIAATNTVDQGLLQDQWPPDAQADIKALANANAAIATDLGTSGTVTPQNYVAWVTRLVTDGAPEMAAANNVRGDLGLPPLPPSQP